MFEALISKHLADRPFEASFGDEKPGGALADLGSVGKGAVQHAVAPAVGRVVGHVELVAEEAVPWAGGQGAHVVRDADVVGDAHVESGAVPQGLGDGALIPKGEAKNAIFSF